LPTFGSDGTGTNIKAADKGAKLTSPKYYACYKSGGDILMKAENDYEVYAAASTWCDSANVGKAKTTSANVKNTIDKNTENLKIAGTAASCVCGSSNFFAVGFYFLAIIASLWK